MTELKENDLQEVSGGANTENYFIYKVVRGDTLSMIAARFGTTVKKIQQLNNIINPDIIKEGQQLTLPTNNNKKGWQ